MWFWVFGWFLVLTSAIGNGLVIYLVITKPRLHTPGNNFIVSLAVADLCASLAFFPPQFCAKFIYTIDLSHAGLFFKVSFAFLYCSNTNLFAMALDRFLAIATPFRHIYLITEKTTWSGIVAAWISPFLLFFFPAIFTHNNNPKYTMLVEISRIIIFQILPLFFVCRCDVPSTSRRPEGQQPDRYNDYSGPVQPCHGCSQQQATCPVQCTLQGFDCFDYHGDDRL